MIIEKIYINNTLVANTIRRTKKTGDCYKMEVDVSNRRKKERIITTFGVGKELTYYDCMVADAVYTIQKNAYDEFSLGQLLRVISGDKQQTLTEQKKTELEASLIKMMEAEFEIVFTEEAEMMGKKEEKLRIRREFLPLEQIDNIFYIKENLPLYEYAELKNQIICVDVDCVFDLGATAKNNRVIVNTSEALKVKHYLIQHIEMMKNKKNNYNATEIQYIKRSHQKGLSTAGMLYDIDIFKENYKTAGGWKNKRQKVHQTVCKILDYFKTTKYIKDYTVLKKGNLITGVEIDVEVNENTR